MSILKSMFVSMYMMAAMAIMVIAARSMWKTGDYVSWGGVLLVSAPFMLLIGWIMVFKNIARTSAHFPFLMALATLGLGMTCWGYLQGASVNAPILALLGWLGFIVYVYWYSSFGDRSSESLKVGHSLPAFELRNVAGEMMGSASLLDKPTIWIFYRGNWCPLCMAQIKELVAEYQEIQELGVCVALISPQPHKFTMSLAKKFNVPFYFLTDEGNRAARLLGIAHDGGLPTGLQVLGYDSETVLPTVIITDAGGKVLWSHQTDNYRVRPEPALYLQVLRENGLSAET
jgi:peroxiredoxin